MNKEEKEKQDKKIDMIRDENLNRIQECEAEFNTKLDELKANIEEIIGEKNSSVLEDIQKTIKRMESTVDVRFASTHNSLDTVLEEIIDKVNQLEEEMANNLNAAEIIEEEDDDSISSSDYDSSDDDSSVTLSLDLSESSHAVKKKPVVVKKPKKKKKRTKSSNDKSKDAAEAIPEEDQYIDHQDESVSLEDDPNYKIDESGCEWWYDEGIWWYRLPEMDEWAEHEG